MQLPARQLPPGHPVPSGSFFLHLPFFRFLQGGHGFFLVSARSANDVLRAVPSATLRIVLRATRREPMVRERARISKRSASIGVFLAV
jgi:hypothetical protein